MKATLEAEHYCTANLNTDLRLIHPVYVLQGGPSKSSYSLFSSTLRLVSPQSSVISFRFPRLYGSLWVCWVACANILLFSLGNWRVNTAESLKHFPSLLLDYQLPPWVSSAQMSAKINGALSAKLIRSGPALLLLITDYFFVLTQNEKKRTNLIK